MLPEQIEAFHAQLRDFLHSLLCCHIIKADLLLKPFVSRMQRHSQGTVVLAEAVRLSEAGTATEPVKSQRQLPLPVEAPRR